VFYKKTFAVYANGANVMLLSVAARRGGAASAIHKARPGALLAGVRGLVAARACGQSQADEGLAAFGHLV